MKVELDLDKKELLIQQSVTISELVHFCKLLDAKDWGDFKVCSIPSFADFLSNNEKEDTGRLPVFSMEDFNLNKA